MEKLKQKMTALFLFALMAPAAFAQTTGPMDTLFDSIDLSGVTAKVIAIGVLVLGIALAFKGVDLGKRAVRKT